jgi:glycosyltransferase involved in cell wall biosynthesis
MNRSNDGRKKIALWGSGIFADHAGSKGIPLFIEILKELSQKHDITIYSHLPLKQIEVSPHLKVKIVPNLGRRARHLMLLVSFLINHAEAKYTLIQAHSSHPDPLISVWLGKLFNIPVIVGYNAGEFVALPHINFGAFLYRKQKKINCYVADRADAITAVSRFHADTINNYLKYPEKVRVIYRGVDQSKFSFQERSITYPIQFIQVGYLHPVKDQIAMVRAFRIIADKVSCHLHIVGPDFWNNTIQDLVRELNLNDCVTFYGALPHDQIVSIYNKAHIMLHTAQYDAIGASVAEAMACGLLVCGTHVGLMADLAETCCLTVIPGDYEALAKKILVIIDDQERMKQLRHNALDWVSKHNLTWAVSAYEKLYDDLSI